NLTARGLEGNVKINTVNGRLEAYFDGLGKSQAISLETVNAPILLTVPQVLSAQFNAQSVKGAISNDFGLAVRKGEISGSEMLGVLGSGSAGIKLKSVHGDITIQMGRKI